MDTVIQSSSSTKDLEFIFRVDEDDSETLKGLIKHYDLKYVKPPHAVNNNFTWGDSSFNVHEFSCDKFSNPTSMIVVVGKRHQYYRNERYIDEMLYISTGEYFVWWADDFLLPESSSTLPWDQLIQEASGQCYIFSMSGRNCINPPRSWPTKIYPKKFFELNNRFVPNFLEDRFGTELMKISTIHVPLPIPTCSHLEAFTDNGIKDDTFNQGRLNWARNRRKNISWTFYSKEDFKRIKKYLDKNPNKGLPFLASLGLSPERVGPTINPFVDCWPPGTEKDMSKWWSEN
jgi:hypothetical protein